MKRAAQDDVAARSQRRGLLGRVGLIAVAVVLVAAGAFLARSVAPSDRDVPPGGGEPTAGGGGVVGTQVLAPGVAFEHLDGQPAELDDWQGKPVVLNFWASWCPPCVAEMRDAFEPLHQELGDRVVFLGVNLQDSEEAARDVIERTGVTYDLARDPDGELFTAFGGFGMPTTALLDENGKVVARHTGALTAGQLDTLVRDHLLEH